MCKCKALIIIISVPQSIFKMQKPSTRGYLDYFLPTFVFYYFYSAVYCGPHVSYLYLFSFLELILTKSTTYNKLEKIKDKNSH